MRLSARAFFYTSIGLAVALAGCSRQSTSLSQPVAAAPAAPAGGYLSLNITHDDPAVVGSSVHVTAAGLPASKTVDLSWGTVSGGWVIEDYYHFRGKKYSETTTSLGRFPTDGSGRLDARFVIPEDYGGVHEVIALVDGKPVAQGGVNVSQTFTLSPTSGPVGTPIEMKVTGLGWRTMESTWVVNWDNQELGFVTAAGTRGSAVARFRAAGPVRRSRREAVYRLAGAGLPQLRTVAGGRAAETAIHVSHDSPAQRATPRTRSTINSSRCPSPISRREQVSRFRPHRVRSGRQSSSPETDSSLAQRCSLCGRHTWEAASAAMASHPKSR